MLSSTLQTRFARWTVVFACGVTAGGCSRDVRLAGRNVRSVTVGSVTHYGVTLDENASAEQVAFAVLRAIRDDFQAETTEDREAALDKQFDLCAANVLQSKNRRAMDRDEFIYNVVYRWTPTVSHYTGDFDTDWDAARKRFRRVISRTAEGDNVSPDECAVVMEVDDPNGDLNARVLLVVYMAKDSGFWRVTHLGFDPTRRSIEG